MIGVAFNGGKESLIILHQNINLNTIVFNIIEDDNFTEIAKYIDKIEHVFNLKILKYFSIEEAILDLKKKYDCKTIVMGNRKTDPECNYLEEYTIMDDYSITKHNPLIDWSYKNVWDYIDINQLPICSLYEKGYTSIGNKDNTFPNYFLFDKTIPGYKHARYLENYCTEKMGIIENSLPKIFKGCVVSGSGTGKQIGFPSAKILPETEEEINFQNGVYYGDVIHNNNLEKMIMFVWKNNQSGVEIIEIHILKKYYEDFYGDKLIINVKGYIRNVLKFQSIDDLIMAIENDIEIANFSNPKY